MRTLSGTLKAAQQATSIDALIKLVLTFGASTYTYTRLEILDLTEKEDGPLHSIEITLDNSDGALTSLDLRGYKGVFSSGAHTGAGDEYSACAPMWVKAQRFDSSEGVLTCTLSLVGICNLMMDDKASAKYMPDEEDTKTIKTLIGEIAGATLTGFTHCTAYDIEWDGEDDLIDSYTPKDAFRVYVGNNRFSKITQLLDLTKCVMRAEADGKLHIFVPTTTGEDFDYEYSLESGHSFWAKAYRNRLTIPNRIYVMSREDDDPAYQGMAYEADSYDKLPKVEFHQTYLESNDQGQDIAEAMLAKAQMWCEAGSANVPMNVGAEVFDYVKVTDSRESDYRVGNIGQIIRHFNLMKNEWRMTFVFGNWQNVRKALAELGITADDLENYFSRLQVGDLYVEHILADNMDFVWIDPDGTIDLSQIGDTLDNLPDGEVYARVKTLHLDAGLIKLDEHILYSSGYNPTDKFDLNNNDLDDVPNGSVYRRVKSAALTAAGLILLDQVVAGTYGLILSADISAGHILLSSVVQSSSYRTVTDGEKGTWNSMMPGDADLDDIGDGVTYSRVRTTSIQAGQILLSETVQSSSYRLVTDGEKGTWNGKPDDMDDIPSGSTYGKIALTDIQSGHIRLWTCIGDLGDISGDLGDISGDLDDIANGATYAKLRATQIDSGYIKLTSATVKSGEWYNESGVTIDAVAGIEIRGGKLTLKDSGGSHGGELYIDSSGFLRLDPWGTTLSENFMPVTNLAYKLGDSNRRWQYIYCNILYGGQFSFTEEKADFANLDYMDLPKKSSNPSAVEGRLYYDTTKDLICYYRNGVGWRIIQDNPY